MDKPKIQQAVEENLQWIVDIRRDLHQHPEPSTKEFRTSDKIVSILKDLGVEGIKKYFNTGVAGVIRGSKNGPTLGLRFDMDAILVEEQTNLLFASQNPGVMHACGHDGHVAIGLGTAKVLMKLRQELEGNVKLIFQPAEENGPQGGGAQFMIKEGVLEDAPKVDAMAGIHMWPYLEYGKMATRVGPMHAGSDPFYLDVFGKGTHASTPHLGFDPIVTSAQIINTLQTIISRNINAFDNAVVTIGMINGGTRHNIIPEKVHIRGTVRTFNEEVRKTIYERIKSIVEKTSEAMGCTVKLNYRFNYGPIMNNAAMVNMAEKAIKEVLGEDRFVLAEYPALAGEDFSYFAKMVPAVYMWLGCKNREGQTYPLHSPYFNFDDEVLSLGTMALTKLALNFCKQRNTDESIFIREEKDND